MSSRVLLDTGPMVAIVSPRDEHHEECQSTMAGLRPPLLTCWPVITEAAWLLKSDLRSLEAVFDSITGGLYQILPLDNSDLDGIRAVMSRYRNIRAQLADAAIVHLAERENTRTVFTIDRRDFGVYRLSSGRALTVIPN